MKSLEGFRTILVAVLSVAGVVLADYGFDLPVEDQTTIATSVMAVAMIVLRLVTKSPVGKKAE